MRFPQKQKIKIKTRYERNVDLGLAYSKILLITTKKFQAKNKFLT